MSTISERRDMVLYQVPLSMSLLGFGMGTMLANFHMCGIMLVLRAVFNMLGSPKCAAITGVGVDMSPHCFIKCPNGSASYTASGSKV